MTTIDMHRSPQRRARPMDMGPSQRTAEVVLGPRLEEYHFVQPARDDSMLDLAGDPADVASARESIRLAFVYVAAFEAYDIPAVVTLMREDAVLSMPPWDAWLQGRDDVGDWMLGPGHRVQGLAPHPRRRQRHRRLRQLTSRRRPSGSSRGRSRSSRWPAAASSATTTSSAPSCSPRSACHRTSTPEEPRRSLSRSSPAGGRARWGRAPRRARGASGGCRRSGRPAT